jgi:hypothetical protein
MLVLDAPSSPPALPSSLPDGQDTVDPWVAGGLPTLCATRQLTNSFSFFFSSHSLRITKGGMVANEGNAVFSTQSMRTSQLYKSDSIYDSDKALPERFDNPELYVLSSSLSSW